MSLDQLLKGLKIFNEGISSYSQGKVLEEANEQLRELNSQQMDLQEKLDIQSQIGNELALRLGKAGADASKIAQATRGLIVSPGAIQQGILNKELQESSQNFKAEQADLDRQQRQSELESSEKMQRTRAASQEAAKRQQLELKKEENLGKTKEKAKRTALRMLDTFRKDKTTSKDIESLITARDLRKVLKPIKGRIDQAQVNFAIKQYIRASGDNRITDVDFETGAPNQGTRSKIARSFGIALSGEALMDDAKFFNTLADRIEQDAETRLDRRIDAFSGRGGFLPEGVDVNEFKQQLRDEALLDTRAQIPEREGSASAPPSASETKSLETLETVTTALKSGLDPGTGNMITADQEKALKRVQQKLLKKIEAERTRRGL